MNPDLLDGIIHLVVQFDPIQNQFEQVQPSIFLLSRGKLQFYNLYARCYGGKEDGDLQGCHSHTAG